MQDTTQQMNYIRGGVNGQNSFHPAPPFIGSSNDLSNLSTDLQQSSYEFEKQVIFHFLLFSNCNLIQTFSALVSKVDSLKQLWINKHNFTVAREKHIFQYFIKNVFIFGYSDNANLR
jgi:hypothetical protein